MLKNIMSILLIAAFFLAGCGSSATATPAAVVEEVTLKVFAPSSMTDAAKELAANFEASNPNVKVVIEFGHSPTQRLQFTEGATGDVFITAAQKDMDDAITDTTVVAGTASVIASNQLVIILSPKNASNLQKLEDLANPGVKLLVANTDTPIGKVTLLAFDKMDKQFGNGFKNNVTANIVSNEPGVKPIVSKVKLDEADAGIVYVSDAVSAPDLKTIAIQAELNMVTKLNAAPLAKSENPDLAAAFTAYLVSAEGQVVLKKWGFLLGTS